MSTAIFETGQETEFLRLAEAQHLKRFIILCDARTHGFCLPPLHKLMPALQECARIVVPAGEANKNADTCTLIWKQLQDLNVQRGTALICLGGGTLLDLGGFAAAVYKRGTPVLYIPTTLLAMTDACLGGKTGVDFNGAKNLLGLFSDPLAIYLNPLFLQTLPERIRRAGFAEMIKHALLSGKKEWQEVQQWSEDDFAQSANVRKSLSFKEHIVNQDPKDQGIRQCLNLGHSIGHALESSALGTAAEWLHGEAVMLGLAAELWLSEQLCGLNPSVRLDFISLRERHFPDLEAACDEAKVHTFLQQDKKNDGTLRMSLLRSPGEPQWGVAVSQELAMEALQHL